MKCFLNGSFDLQNYFSYLKNYYNNYLSLSRAILYNNHDGINRSSCMPYSIENQHI